MIKDNGDKFLKFSPPSYTQRDLQRKSRLTSRDSFTNNPYYSELNQKIHKLTNLEEKLDFLRIFKKSKTEPLQKKVLSTHFELIPLMLALSQLADALNRIAFEIAQEELRKTYGLPRCKDNDGNFINGNFAMIAMGKFGGNEIHFSSDLDMIFIFNKNGSTYGGKEITNQEYYAKLTQRIISYLSLYTQKGYAYQVDTELRPSGQAGALVTPLEPWLSYYHQRAALWEHQALLKARLVYATEEFGLEFQGLFKRLTFLKPFPENFGQEIHHMRQRIEVELAKETSRRWHFKKGRGGIMDIEFAIQYLQLKLGKMFDDILHPATLNSLAKLKQRKLISKEKAQLLQGAYEFYRCIEFYLELKFNLKEGYIDPQGEYIEELAVLMRFAKAQRFVERLAFYREEVRKTYGEIVKK